ncbi:MAG TPA: hypothetical protein VGX71_27625 [Pseudaminobacter sp.]|nr:hypothetical protein [Pseudaminobacter sp.]
MPNTPVRAAAEGMPTINRRNLLTGTAVTAAVAFMASPADADASPLIALIQAHKAAKAAFLEAIDLQEDMDKSYFAGSKKEIIVPLSITGGVSLDTDWDQAEWAVADCRKRIVSAYKDQRSRLAPMERYAPDLHKAALEELRIKQIADLREMRSQARAEQRRQDEHGYGGANRRYWETSDAEMGALTAICAFRCATDAERAMKAEYLLSIKDGTRDELQSDDVIALLQSLVREGGAS